MDTYLSSNDCMGRSLPDRNDFGYVTKSMACSITGATVDFKFVTLAIVDLFLQTTGFIMTAAGYILGHSHKGRMFQQSAHGTFAQILFLPMAAQLLLGIYMKMHIHKETLRPWAVRVHGIVGKSYPIFAWTQMLFGAVTFRGYCREDLAQCLAHYIMVCGK